jgi:hypothetical protein
VAGFEVVPGDDADEVLAFEVVTGMDGPVTDALEVAVVVPVAWPLDPVLPPKQLTEVVPTGSQASPREQQKLGFISHVVKPALQLMSANRGADNTGKEIRETYAAQVGVFPAPVVVAVALPPDPGTQLSGNWQARVDGQQKFP